MKNPILHSYSNVSNNHIIFNLKVGFKLNQDEIFSDGVNNLIDIISFGGKSEFRLERSGARHEYEVKIISIDDDPIAKEEEAFGRIQLAIPIKFCLANLGIPLLLSTIMYASVYSFITEFQVCDITLPDDYLKHLPKPKYGVSIFPESDRAFKIGMILKPRSILNKEIVNKLINNEGISEIDYIADDELTIDPPEWSFNERTSYVMSLINEIYCSTRKKIKYIANITASYKKCMELAKIAQDLEIDGVMINTITMGYDVLHELASDKSFKPFIVANTIGRNLVSGGPKYLIADHLHCLLARLSGADAVYTGPFIGNIKARREKAAHFTWALTDKLSKNQSVKASYAIMSGGLDLKNILGNYRIYSSPVMFSIGLSLCNLIEEGISVGKILKIVNTVFAAEKIGGQTKVEQAITELATNNKEYLKILNKLEWK